jgi:transcriptional regulator with XRE-family HTH domain
MDWKNLISELLSEGYTQPQLAQLCCCSQTAISELATGKTSQPRFSTGDALIKLHKKAQRKRASRNRGETHDQASTQEG